MPLTTVALVLVAALLHALWNIVAKKSGGGAHFVLMGALLGGKLLGEADRGARLLGAACIAGGVITLALG